MKLKCDLIIQNLNHPINSTNSTINPEKMHKGSTIGLYRPSLDEMDSNTEFNSKYDIILTVETKTFSLKYKLKKIETYTKFISEGKATIKLIDENVFLLISNTTSMTLTNFISFLNAKMVKSKLYNKENFRSNQDTKKYVNKLLNNAQCTLGKNNLTGISPLCEKDINDVMKVRANAKIMNESPIRANPSRKALSSISSNKSSPLVRSASSCSLKKMCMTQTSSTQLTKMPSETIGLIKRSSSMNNLLIELTQEQKKVLSAIKNGKNVFFTGSGGTGKSFLISVIKKCLPHESCFVTASTGAAASLINGITLHAFSGLTSESIDNSKNNNDNFMNYDEENESDHTARIKKILEKILNSKEKLNNWKKCKHLIIDEISMIDSNLFDTLDSIARSIKNNDLPFGGIQIILSGDFFQLPPVSKYGEEKKKFCFQSDSWANMSENGLMEIVELTEIKRQKDRIFIDLLEEVRYGKCSDKTIQLLEKSKDRVLNTKDILPTKLCTHKDDVEFINKKELDALKTTKYTYNSIDSGDLSNTKKLLNSLCIARESITLAEHAQVMLTKNLDVSNNLVNGSRGCVVGFTESKLPIVRFLNGTEMIIKHDTWSFRVNSNGLMITRKQLPLSLAWAISIHKSQGMTLDCVELSLSRVFEYGQAYVALSRAKSLECIKIIDFDINAIKANPTVVKFYREIKKM